MEEETIQIEYIGEKALKYDNVCKTGVCWQGKGDVVEVTASVAKRLLNPAFKAIWRIFEGGELPANTPDFPILEKSQKVIAEDIPNMSDMTLAKLRESELAGKARKGVITAIEDEIYRRESL